MQAEVSHAAAKVGIGSSGFTGKLLLGEMCELVREGIAVRHRGPTFPLGNWHGGSRLWCLGCSLCGTSVHS